MKINDHGLSPSLVNAKFLFKIHFGINFIYRLNFELSAGPIMTNLDIRDADNIKQIEILYDNGISDPRFYTLGNYLDFKFIGISNIWKQLRSLRFPTDPKYKLGFIESVQLT